MDIIKPTLSILEANWHTHLAGVQAEKQSRTGGVQPDEAATLLDAAGGGRLIGKVKFPPITAAFMMLLARASQICEKRPELAPDVMGSEMGHLGALAFILHNPQLAWQIMTTPNGEDLFAKAVVEFAMEFDLADLRALCLWIGEEMARLRTNGDNAGKPPAE